MTAVSIATILSNPALTPAEVRQVLRAGRNATYNAIRDGSIPSFKFGGQYRVPTVWIRKQLGLPDAAA
jgi:excisionase family DNA binding protein